jgi:hypothetical protein
VPEAVPVPAQRSLIANEVVKAGQASSKSRRPGLRLTMYLPNHTPFVVYVATTATVEDVLQEVLREHKREHAGTPAQLPTYASRCFEIRLPDGDRVGYPDDDVPGG